MKGKRIKRRTYSLLDGAFLLAALLLLLVLALVWVLPTALSLTPYAVASDSMAPTLSPGDLVYVRPAQLSDVAPGNVIAYEKDGTVLTHRVYQAEDGVLRTKADASVYLDPYTVDGDNLLGRVVYKLPLLGRFSLVRESAQ